MSNLILSKLDLINAILEVDFEKISKSCNILNSRINPEEFSKNLKVPFESCDGEEHRLLRYNSRAFSQFIYPYIRYNPRFLIRFGCADRFIELCPKIKLTSVILHRSSLNDKQKICETLNANFSEPFIEIDSGDSISILHDMWELLYSDETMPYEIRKGRNEIIKFLLESYTSYIFYTLDEGDIPLEFDTLIRVIDDVWKKAYGKK